MTSLVSAVEYGNDLPYGNESQSNSSNGSGNSVGYNAETGEVKYGDTSIHTSINPSVGGSGGGFSGVKIGDVEVQSVEQITIRDSKLFMKTDEGEKQINVLPEQAISSSELSKSEVNKIELKKEGQIPIYFIEGSKPVKFLGLFSVTMNIQSSVNVENGSVISVNKPWWSFLVR